MILGRHVLQVIQALAITWRRGLASGRTTRKAPPFRGRPVLPSGAASTLCNQCGTCVKACPTGCLSLEGTARGHSFKLDWRRCMCCGRCAAVCPAHAIELTSESMAHLILSLPQEGEEP